VSFEFGHVYPAYPADSELLTLFLLLAALAYPFVAMWQRRNAWCVLRLREAIPSARITIRSTAPVVTLRVPTLAQRSAARAAA
jgi:hypothetical protein